MNLRHILKSSNYRWVCLWLLGTNTIKCNYYFSLAEHRTGACANKSELITYLLTPDAQEQLDAHQHVTVNVFEPVFILGSFPFLILCMFMR